MKIHTPDMSSSDFGQMVPHLGSGTVPFPPDGTQLHFRQEQNGRLIMIGHCCTVVDIHINEDAMHHIKHGGTLLGRDKGIPVLEFTWEDVDTRNIIKRKLHLQVTELLEDFYQNLCDGFVEDSFKLTRDFVQQLYERYQVLLLNVMLGSVVFEIAHVNETSVKKMESEKETTVLQMCKEFLRKCSRQNVNITLTFEAVIHTEAFHHFSHRGSSQGLYRDEGNLHSLSESMTSRIQALAKQQALTREKVKTIAEALSSTIPSRETATEDGQSGGAFLVSDKTTPDLTDVLGLVTLRETVSEIHTMAVAAPVLDDQSVHPFGQSGAYPPTHSSDTVHRPASQESEQQSVPQNITQTSTKQTFMQSDAETEAKSDRVSSVSSTTSAGGAKPKVRGASSESILSIVRSARGDKSDLGFKRISESVEAALIDETPVPPRAESLSTILCLDTSESMTGETFKQMKRIAEIFVDGVEDVAGEFGLEENVAVVSMSGSARVVQHLTNDYARIRDCLDSLESGGLSPIFETLAVALAAIQGKAGVINVCGVHRVRPRIIFITDGKVTDVDQQGGLDALSAAGKIPLIKLVSKLGSQKHGKSSYTVVWIPVGSSERDFLNSLATLGKGQMVEERDVPKLARYFRMQESIGKIYAHVRGSADLQKDLEKVIKALVPEFPSEDKEEITRTVVDMLKTKNEERGEDFDSAYENPELLPLGTRVVRGPDWKWGDQDSGGVGTVINHSRDSNYIHVSWDRGGRNRYRYNVGGAFDLLPVDDCPRFPESQHFLQIGIRVQKDPSHQTGTDRKGEGNSGVVIRINDRGLVKVRWDDGNIGTHKFESNGVKELLICDPAVLLTQKPSSIRNKSKRGFPQQQKHLERKPGHTVWRWRDERGQWHLYPRETQQKLKQEYQRRPDGSCLIMKGSDSFRVFFKTMNEKCLETSARHEVEVQPVDNEDL